MNRYRFRKNLVIDVISKDFYKNPVMLTRDLKKQPITGLYTKTGSSFSAIKKWTPESNRICFPLNKKEHAHIIKSYKDAFFDYFSSVSRYTSRLCLMRAHHLRRNDFHQILASQFQIYCISPLFLDDVYNMFIKYITSLPEEEYTLTANDIVFEQGVAFHDAEFSLQLQTLFFAQYPNLDLMIQVSNESFKEPDGLNRTATLNVFRHGDDYYLHFRDKKTHKRFEKLSTFDLAPSYVSPFQKELM